MLYLSKQINNTEDIEPTSMDATATNANDIAGDEGGYILYY